MNKNNKPSSYFNPFIIDITHTTAHTLFWPPRGLYYSKNLSYQKLNAELEKERKLERMRRRFVSDVSHELKIQNE